MQLEALQREEILILANTLPSGIAAFVDNITVKGVCHGITCGKYRLLDNECQTSERVLVINTQGQLFLTGDFIVELADVEEELVVLFPSTLGCIFVVEIDSRLLTRC